MLRLVNLLFLATVVALAGCATTGKQGEDEAAKALYQEAQDAMASANYEQAVNTLETLQARYPFGPYAEQAQLDIIYAYHKAGDPDSAISAADRFIKLNPRHPAVPYAQYMKGVVQMGRGQSAITRAFGVDRASRNPKPLQAAFRSFDTVITEYPDSPYAEDARKRMVIIRDMLSRHELHIAQFYMDRGAYVAAANRAKNILKTYDETPAVEKALEIMVKAYKKLHMPKLRQDALRVLRENYPNNPLVKRSG